MQLCGSLSILWHCLSLGLEWKLTFSSPMLLVELPSSGFPNQERLCHFQQFPFSCPSHETTPVLSQPCLWKLALCYLTIYTSYNWTKYNSLLIAFEVTFPTPSVYSPHDPQIYILRGKSSGQKFVHSFTGKKKMHTISPPWARHNCFYVTSKLSHPLLNFLWEALICNVSNFDSRCYSSHSR